MMYCDILWNMKYKLIAVDMDGTLLNDNGQITPDTVVAIKSAIASNVIFTISTGRPIQGVDKYSALLSLKAPIITCNGAMVVQADTKEVLFSQTLLSSDAMRIFERGTKMGITMCVWANNRLYCNVLNERVDYYKSISDVDATLIDDFEMLAKSGITKILWYDEADAIAEMQEQLKKVPFEKVTYCTSRPIFLEFFNSDVSKAEAMKKIGELYNIKREEMIAIGDGYNDLPMIEYAGLGVAMANAPDGVKQHSDYVTQRSNNDDGIAEVIKKFIGGSR